jgi:transcriptional regulator with XRE-family HTH domain
MKLNLKYILFEHYIKTGEYITQTQIAREIVKLGIYKNEHVAQNMLQRWITGKSNPPLEVLKYLSGKFNKTINQLLV